jgi:hypothetical protein
MAEDLTTKTQKAILDIQDKVGKIAEIVYDVGLKLTEMTYDANLKLHHVLETRFQYRTLPAGIDYDEYEI